jgi:hypothetical protein
VVDAAGAIYVLGGESYSGTNDFRDVWASTDGGARGRTASGVVGVGVLGAYYRGY